MKKIPSLFKRDYEGTRQAYNEVVEGSEWVLLGEGTPYTKIDGTSCMVKDNQLYKRYDRRITKSAKKRLKREKTTPTLSDFKPAPDGWVACEESPNLHTGHWPGWVKVDTNNPEDKWHIEAALSTQVKDGTYELIGPKIQGNPYNLKEHILVDHCTYKLSNVPTTFDGLRRYLTKFITEGIVWHHPDGRMVKLKRKDFGLPWPVTFKGKIK